MESSLFSSGGGFLSSKLLPASPLYINIHSRFAPIVYHMLGYSMISLQSSRILTLSMSIDTDYILSIGSLKGIDYIYISYLTIGQKMI